MLQSTFADHLTIPPDFGFVNTAALVDSGRVGVVGVGGGSCIMGLTREDERPCIEISGSGSSL